MRVVKGVWVLLVVMLALGPATWVAAQDQNNSEIPGSVLVFHKFVNGTIVIDGVRVPRTEIEISVTCPAGFACDEGRRVKLAAHWVCPGSQETSDKLICRETDFEFFATINETSVINPPNLRPPGTEVTARRPPAGCNEGYLIVWVIDIQGRPIKWDGLIGNAVIRHDPSSAGAYSAYPIQAVSALTTGALVPLGSGGSLLFDGVVGYKRVPGVIQGTVRFERPPTDPPTLGEIRSFLTLLTLDVRSNRPNYPTFVDLEFWNQNEEVTSSFWEFVCWAQVRLTALDSNLDEPSQISGTVSGRKGYFVSQTAEKVPIFGIFDTAGPVTLLGIVETQEFNAPAPPAVPGVVREYSYSTFNDGIGVPTAFFP
jgi:hypothetical protein